MKDKHNREIQEFDLLKVFHFIGARNKKHYMYKWIKIDKQTGDLMGHSLDPTGHHFNLYSVVNKNLVWESAEIVQSHDDRKKLESANK